MKHIGTDGAGGSAVHNVTVLNDVSELGSHGRGVKTPELDRRPAPSGVLGMPLGSRSAGSLPVSHPLDPIPVDLAGKTAIVTGTTSGIGHEIAYGLASLGAHVVMVGRTAERAEAARRRLILRGTPAHHLETAAADLSRLGQVAELAKRLAGNHPALDILVNNAGCYPAGCVITPDGIEESWATNVLAYEVFTTVLRPSLEAAVGRVIYVSSSMSGDLKLNDLGWEHRRWSGMRAYKQSKKAVTMLAWAWRHRLEGTGVTINVAHPDGTATNIAGRQRGIWGFVTRLAFSTQRTPAEGADTALWLATSPDLSGRSGDFYLRRRTLEGQYQNDIDAIDRVWTLTQKQIQRFL